MSEVAPTESSFIDLSDRTKLRVTGADRVRFLNGQVSNDVRLATRDDAVYTGVMTIKGKLCADAFIHAGEESLWLDAESSVRESLLARLERYIVADDVQLANVSDEYGLLHLLDYGSDTESKHKSSVATMLTELGPDCDSNRTSRFGRTGLDLVFPVSRRSEILNAVHGARFALLNEDGVESLRISAGVPRWGAELDENTLPAEAGIEERAVSYSKGCYIGQEVVSRVKSVGHVNRQLRGLRALDASPLYPGMILLPANLNGEADVSARPVGTLTSAASSSGHGGAAYLALGYVRRGWEAPGTRLFAALPAEDTNGFTSPACPVEVCALPFILP